MTGFHRTLAERMQASFQQAPQMALTANVDASAPKSTRADFNGLADQQMASKATLTMLLVHLTSEALPVLRILTHR